MPPFGRLAVVTALYPGVEPFLASWYRSVEVQRDRDFDLWVALDGLTPAGVRDAVGHDVEATWVAASPGDTPARVRQRVLEPAAERYDGVVLVDGDDLLRPSRVGAARRALRHADLSVCALRLVDETGRDLGATLGLPAGADAAAVLPRTNIFGLSNTAYRSDLLRRCLPIPTVTEAVDWYLATRAWLLGATIHVDPVARMDYRQHGSNMTVVQPPFSEALVRHDTARVLSHLALAASAVPEDARPDRVLALATATADVAAFRQHVVSAPQRLSAYVQRLEELAWPVAWWSHIARHDLADMWREPED